MPAIKKEVGISYDEALTRVTEALASEGFGVLTEIDVKATLKKKIGEDFRPYKILGACNPKLAHRALGADIDVGVLLPCNVVVYSNDEGRTVISMMDPLGAIGAFGDDTLSEIAAEVRQKLDRVLAAVE